MDAFCPGQNPLTVVEGAIAKRAKLTFRGEYSAADGDETWAVFDGEEHRQDEAQTKRFNDAIALAQENDIKIANTEPCVELWFLLHRKDVRGALHRTKAKSELKVFYPHYEKGDESFFDELGLSGDEINAKKRAIDLRTMHQHGGRDQHLTNPCTRMDQIVAAIQALVNSSAVPVPTKEDIKRLIEQQQDELRRYKVSALVLYGAFSRGDVTSGSKVEIVIDFTEANGLAFFKNVESILERLLGRTVYLLPSGSVDSLDMVAFEREKFTLL